MTSRALRIWVPLCTEPPSVPHTADFVTKNLLNNSSRWGLFPALLLAAALPLSCFSAGETEELGSLYLEHVHFGRLVDVVDINGNTWESNVVVDPSLVGDGVSYSLSTNPVTESEVLTILEPLGSAAGRVLLDRAKLIVANPVAGGSSRGLPIFSTKGFRQPPPFNTVPRNSALLFIFSQPVDPTTVQRESIQVTAGNPPVVPMTGVFITREDESTGKGIVIYDTTISARQSAELGLPQNATGFPGSLDAVDYSLQIDIPTVAAPELGQPFILKSLNGLRRIAHDKLGDRRTLASGTAINLVARAGGDLDDAHGFMRDNTLPNLVGRFDAVIDTVTTVNGPTADIEFHVVELNCQGVTAKRGDVFEIGSSVGVVTNIPEPIANNAWKVTLNMLTYQDLGDGQETGGLSEGDGNMDARLSTVYRAQDKNFQACFLDIQPPPSGGFPATGIDPNSTVTIRFDEPIDPTTVLSMHSFVVAGVEDQGNPDFFGPAGSTMPGTTLAYYEGVSASVVHETVVDELLAPDNGNYNVTTYNADITTGGGFAFSGPILAGSVRGKVFSRFLDPPVVYFKDDGAGGLVEDGPGNRIEASSTVDYSGHRVSIKLTGAIVFTDPSVPPEGTVGDTDEISFIYTASESSLDPFEGVCAYPPLPGFFRGSLKPVGSVEEYLITDFSLGGSTVGEIRGVGVAIEPTNVVVDGSTYDADVPAHSDIFFETVSGVVTSTVLGVDEVYTFASNASGVITGDNISPGSDIREQGGVFKLHLVVDQGTIVDSSVAVDFQYEFSDDAGIDSTVNYETGELVIYMPGPATDVDDNKVVIDYQYSNSESSADFIDRLPGYDLAVKKNQTMPRSEFAGRVYFGPIEVGDGNRSFTLSPLVGFTETNDDDYLAFLVALRDGADGIRDLSGNVLGFAGFFAGSSLPITVNGGGGVGAASHDSYFCLRAARDFDENGDGSPEWAGQVSWANGAVSGRNPERFSREADAGNGYVGAKPSLPQGLPEPLVPSGAVLMTVHRPQDFGFAYNSPLEYNMDIDGAAWSPFGAKLYDDYYSDISLSFAHANVLPDETLNLPFSQLPLFPGSGLSAASFNDNILGFDEIVETEVFRSGYTMRGLNLFPVPSGAMFVPWPSFNRSFTWRDTDINPLITGGALDSYGSPPMSALIAPGDDPYYGPGDVPATDLGLLARFRCYPQQLSHTLPLNTFQTTNMVAISALPAWRIFSSGGRDSAGKWREVIPDNVAAGGTVPSGGYDAAGLSTQQMDTYLYWMQLDFSIRVSRVYTHWFDVGSAIPNGGIKGVLIEPSLSTLPAGTDIQIDFRGAVSVTHPTNASLTSPLTSAQSPFDAWGNFKAGASGGVSAPSEWSTDIYEIEGQQYRYFQVRLTIISNPDLGLSPSLDGLGIVWGGM